MDRLLAGGLLTLCLFATFGLSIMLFLFATVLRQPESMLMTNPGAFRSFKTIANWNEWGYFASAGLLNRVSPTPDSPTPRRVIYRSSTGIYMLSGHIVEKIALLTTGKYQWRLMAIHNQLLMVLISALIGLLVYRTLLHIGVERRQALALALATLSVFLTFPDIIAQYWELSAHSVALLFAILFLLLESVNKAGERRRFVVYAQIAAAFCVAYSEWIYGAFFLLAYCAFRLLTDTQRSSIRDIALRAALPAAAALLLFSLQLSWVRHRYPDVPFQGTAFMSRTGLDGSTQYYHGHSDIIYRRDIARGNFPVNRESLFNWRALFIAGLIATTAVIIAGTLSAPLRSLLLMMIPLLGAYTLYAALFSQAVVIHPYYYDMFIATPLIMALFGFAPGILEERLHTQGVIALITIFTAAWCAMVQVRHYAMWYPLPK